jgi:DNA-binding response OmpR family regulator
MVAKHTTILLADDDQQLLRLLMRTLQLEGYEVLLASDGEQALVQVTAHMPDLVLLDVMMPKVDGFTVCQQVRAFSAVPIIMLTARGLDQDKAHGLDLGADDFLGKPFSMDELLARVRAVLRRSHFTPDESPLGLQSIMRMGDLVVDYAQHQVTNAGQEVALTPTEFRLLAILAQNADHVTPQDCLLEYIWGEEYSGDSHILQVNVNRLRHKLEADPAHPRIILTKAGVGYLFSTHDHT